MIKNSVKKGFTLIEMLIAMVIFIVFTGLLLNSYMSVVKAIRGANEYRVMYSDARHVFDVITEVARESRYYGKKLVGSDYRGFSPNGVAEFTFYSADWARSTLFKFEDDGVDGVDGGRIVMVEDGGMTEQLHSDAVYVKDFRIYVWPLKDPYDQTEKFALINYFQPKVTITATFATKGMSGQEYSFDLQTTVSSRIYN